jgi:hypothetical protein
MLWSPKAGLGALRLQDHPAVIMATMAAKVVRALEFPTIRALVEGFHWERVVRAAVAPAMR